MTPTYNHITGKMVWKIPVTKIRFHLGIDLSISPTLRIQYSPRLKKLRTSLQATQMENFINDTF